MGLDELAGERQAKAQRGLSAHAGAVKAREHLSLILGGYAGTVIDDGDHSPIVVAAGLEPNMPALVGIGDGVTQNMLDGLPQAARIADNAAHAWFEGDL